MDKNTRPETKSELIKARERRMQLAKALEDETDEERRRELQAELDELQRAYTDGELDEIQTT